MSTMVMNELVSKRCFSNSRMMVALLVLFASSFSSKLTFFLLAATVVSFGNGTCKKRVHFSYSI